MSEVPEELVGTPLNIPTAQLRRRGLERERRALRLIAISFFALAAFVVVEAGRELVIGTEAEESPVGIALAATSLAVMPALALAKRRTGERLGSATLVADSTETLLCAYLSATLLVGPALLKLRPAAR